jgi:hypothetical protein
MLHHWRRMPNEQPRGIAAPADRVRHGPSQRWVQGPARAGAMSSRLHSKRPEEKRRTTFGQLPIRNRRGRRRAVRLTPSVIGRAPLGDVGRNDARPCVTIAPTARKSVEPCVKPVERESIGDDDITGIGGVIHGHSCGRDDRSSPAVGVCGPRAAGSLLCRSGFVRDCRSSRPDGVTY